MRILVNGEERELTAIGNNGIEWTRDLLGNYDALPEYDEEADASIMSEDDFDWWQKEIEKLNEIAELEEELDDEDFSQYYKDCDGADLEQQTEMQLNWLHEKLGKQFNYKAGLPAFFALDGGETWVKIDCRRADNRQD